MSEYQYYEFLAVDRPLDERQQAEVRALSSRARITATSFTNEYHWGNFRGDPRKMMERYYDAHLYLTNWGTHQVMLRLGVRAELAAGDLRPLYLAWLAAYGTWERDEDAFDHDEEGELEPPVPAGLGVLTAPQRALADFLRLDADLLTIAAQASPPLAETKDDPRKLARWIKDLPPADKDALLHRVAQGRGAQVQMELRRRFRGEPDTTSDSHPRRTVGELLDAAPCGVPVQERILHMAGVERGRACAGVHGSGEVAGTPPEPVMLVDELARLSALEHVGQDPGLQAGGQQPARVLRVHDSGYTEDMDDSQNHLSVRDARAHFAELITRAQGGTPTIITRNGQPVAAVVPVEDFNALEDAIDRYFAREADRDLAENPDAPTYSMSEVVAAIFEEETGKGVA